METALGGAKWLLGKVLAKLSDELVAGFVASRELGLNFDKMKTEMNFTLALLHAAQGRDFTNNPGLRRLLEALSNKADEAEDALDELHYFIIEDELDGTCEATPDIGHGLGDEALHVRRAVTHTAANWFSCFNTCFSHEGNAVVPTATTQSANQTAGHAENDTEGPNADKLPFKRVTMSNKIKKLIEDIHSLCDPVSKLLQIYVSSSPQLGSTTTLKRPETTSMSTEEKLFGRDEIFNQTLQDIFSGQVQRETLSVLPVVGSGGIGKTTFTQHLYCHEQLVEHFDVRIWVCVSNYFDVHKLTNEILCSIDGGISGPHSAINLNQLQECIAMKLKAKRFLIVLDDVWTCNSLSEWNTLIAPFAKVDTKGSIIIPTTRFPRIADMVTKGGKQINLHGLDSEQFWLFFEQCVFGGLRYGHAKDDLTNIARNIAGKLKRSPLAAKTVGRLLAKDSSQEHWNRILEKEEWLNQTNEDDIMPALRISYDYLPFRLKKCFAYCSLFPEDHKFDKLEISNFWDALGILDSIGGNTIEDKGSKILGELVSNGFLMTGADQNVGNPRAYYVMHDLFHELARNVSSQECININCSRLLTADGIPPSIRHLSITLVDDFSNDLKQEMVKLKGALDVEKLQTLMIFETNRPSIGNLILKDIFHEMKDLRVLFLYLMSVESLPNNFSNLLHLRFLKISSPPGTSIPLPISLSRFYHLQFLDLRHWKGCIDVPKNISRLVNLRHFLSDNRDPELHSSVPRVGRMKHLQELKKFIVKKERVGFEVNELGSLTELGGALSICNLENVSTAEEAKEARLMDKRNIHTLSLVWSRDQLSGGIEVLEGLQPNSNLRELYIVNPGGSFGPSWLCGDIITKNLELLSLEGVSWANLPRFGLIRCLRVLSLSKVTGLRQLKLGFCAHLERISFRHMPELVEWVEDPDHHLFPRLEWIICMNCPNLTVLSILDCFSSYTQNINTPNLWRLDIERCPKLPLPPFPHTSMRTVYVNNQFVLNENTSLWIRGYSGDIVFQNLGKLEKIQIENVANVSLSDLQSLKTLRKLTVKNCEGTVFRGLDHGVVLHSVQILELWQVPLSGLSMSNLFNCFVALLELKVILPVVDHEEVILVQLPLPSSLQKVHVQGWANLILPVEDGGVSKLTSLRALSINDCGQIFSRWTKKEAAQIIYPFPASLKELCVEDETSMQSMGLLANLMSLTKLELSRCTNLTTDGFNPLIAINLKSLVLHGCGSVGADLLSEVARTKTLPQDAFRQLEYLEVDSISSALVAPFCRNLSATLKKLNFRNDQLTDGFIEDQEEALRALTSLQELRFQGCSGLQSLPRGLCHLGSLKSLYLVECPRIRSLPKEVLPAALSLLSVWKCNAEIHEECRKLKETVPYVYISY